MSLANFASLGESVWAITIDTVHGRGAVLVVGTHEVLHLSPVRTAQVQE